jgi:hypothetical protein
LRAVIQCALPTENLMLKSIAFGAALALAASSLAGCSNFVANAAADAAALNQVNTALIQLNATIIANQTQLAAALAQTYCPIINGSVSLGAAIKGDLNVAASVKAKLTAAGPSGALASDVCIAAGYGPTTPAAAVPASVPVTPSPSPSPSPSPTSAS